LERNYVDMMTFIGWNRAATEVVDAAVHKHHSNVLHSGGDTSTGDSGDNNGSGGKNDTDVAGHSSSANTTDTNRNADANGGDTASKTSKASKKSTSNTNSTSKPIFPFISSITGDNMSRNMFVVAIVIGLVSYSVRVFYSRA